jgi:catechol 2,3-dioxygenase-like lactoylglutathione lyase family enzyme
MIKGMHHANVVVSDMERTKKFYAQVLGLQVALETLIDDREFARGVGSPGTKVLATFFAVPGTSTLIETFQFLHPSSRQVPADSKPTDMGVGHICFEVEDIHQAYNELCGKGVEFASTPVTISSEHPVAGGIQWCYFYGPDRERLEILQMPRKR